MTDLMPHKKTWTSEEGVQIEMISYRTVLVDRIRSFLKKYMNEAGELEDTAATFVLCAATTTAITLPADNVPMWAQIIHDLITSPTWRKNPLADFESLDFAPSDVLVNWWHAYLATRETAHAAPPELQVTPPLPPEAYEGTEADQTTENPTPLRTLAGGKFSTSMSLSAPAKPLSERRVKKAT